MRRIVEFTYNYYVEHEGFVRLVVAENQARGRHLRKSRTMRTLNRPIIDRLARVIERGQAEGAVRAGASIPVEVHKAIAALGMFNVTNQYTFGSDLPARDGRARATSHGSCEMVTDVILELSDTEEEGHEARIDRRTALKAGAALAAAACSVPAWAQAKPTIRFAAVFSDKDIRADMIRMFAKDVDGDFNVEPFYNGSLFKQGTELVALQRDNLEMGNIAPQDISKQIPAWSILTSAYLFRDANHLNAFLAERPRRADEEAWPRTQVKVKILGPTFFGTRQVGLKPNKKINTPADLAGIKLRMPPGDAWQLLGRSLGANPTPMAYAEVYTGLQTGAIDGQDNPLPNVQNMKFYEVMSQIVLTSHLVGYDLLTVNLKTWNAHVAGAAEGLPGRRRQGDRLERGRAPEARGRAGRRLPQAGPARSTRPDAERLPRARAEGLPRLRRGEGLAEGDAREDQRAEVERGVSREAARLAAAPGGERRRRPARRHVRRVHRADRVPLLLQLPDRLDLRADA